jgi:hypothetical protein
LKQLKLCLKQFETVGYVVLPWVNVLWVDKV